MPTPAELKTVWSANVLNWHALGLKLRVSAESAHGLNVGGEMPNVALAYSFLLDNPECFGFEEWPADMPGEPNVDLACAYHGNAF
jgi:hypothetical protein